MTDDVEVHTWGPFVLTDYISDSAFCRRRTLRVFGVPLWWPWPVASGLHSSCAMVLGWPVYGADAPWFIGPLHRVLSRLSDARYWMMYRLVPSHQYHIIRTGLPPGYHDNDRLMLYACMKLLCQYVKDHEGPDALVKFSADLREHDAEDHSPEGMRESQANRQDTAVEIYRWWKVQRPADKERRKRLTMELYGGKRRWHTKPTTDNPLLTEMVFDEMDEADTTKRKELWALEEKITDDEQAMLHKLVDIRLHIWT